MDNMEMTAEQRQMLEHQQNEALQAQQQYNSESDEEQYELENGYSDEPGYHKTLSWVQWFCSIDGHEFLTEVDPEFIRDQFNLYGLNAFFAKDKLKACLRMILSPQQPSEEDLADDAFLELNQEASDLYGLLHCRFISTPRGMAKVYQKFLNGVFGTCPRALCDRQKVLPVGLSDTLRTSRFKTFCPRCEEVYIPKTREINLDGAFFGTSFPHAFLKHYPLSVILPPKVHFYEPKIAGFNIKGKRGSKYFAPPRGSVKFIEGSMQGILAEEAQEIQAREARSMVANDLAAEFESKVALDEDEEATQVKGGRKGGRKGRKQNAH